MVTCQSSELGWEVTVELPADFLSLGRGSVSANQTPPIFDQQAFAEAVGVAAAAIA